jgi:hypothetical protein
MKELLKKKLLKKIMQQTPWIWWPQMILWQDLRRTMLLSTDKHHLWIARPMTASP